MTTKMKTFSARCQHWMGDYEQTVFIDAKDEDGARKALERVGFAVFEVTELEEEDEDD